MFLTVEEGLVTAAVFKPNNVAFFLCYQTGQKTHPKDAVVNCSTSIHPLS